jgi:exosortase
MKRMAARVRALLGSASGRTVFVLAAPAVCLLWAYWPTLATMAERWSSDPQYSHGFLVPVFALVVLWARRDSFPAGKIAPSWWGLPLLALGLVLWLGGAAIYLPSVGSFSLLPTLAALCLLVGGWAALRWSWPAIAFLAFMLPLPYQVEQFLAHPLRRMATASSTYLLQALGYPALAEGNVILIGDLKLGVVEACSGLGMLMTFFALSTAMALIVRRGPLDRALLVVSAVPIALIANILRITATAAAHVSLGSDAANGLLHDVSGWLMMPLALGLLWLELLYLDRLFIPAAKSRPLPLQLTGGVPLPYPRKPGEGPVPCEPPVPAGRAAGTAQA